MILKQLTLEDLDDSVSIAILGSEGKIIGSIKLVELTGSIEKHNEWRRNNPKKLSQ